MAEFIPSEDDEQLIVVQYLETKGLKFTSVPNHTYNPHFSQQAKNYKLGLRKGLPDLVIVIPNVGLLFIEMKRVKKSQTSPEQLAWVAALNTCPGVAAHICKGAEAAIVVIEAYLPKPVK